MRTYALPKIGLVFGRVRHKILLVGFAEFRLPKGEDCGRKFHGDLSCGNFSLSPFSPLALAGGVAAVSTINRASGAGGLQRRGLLKPPPYTEPLP